MGVGRGLRLARVELANTKPSIDGTSPNTKPLAPLLAVTVAV